MKTVAAEIHSSTPVTICKAASVLSKFVSAETGASQAVNAYLRRATAALDELVRLHSKSDRKKHKKHKSDSSAVTATGGIPTRSVELSQGPTVGFENGRRKLDFGNVADDEGRPGNEVKEEKSRGEDNVGEDMKKNKKDKRGDFDEGGVEEEIGRKKHKNKRRNGDSLGDSEVIGVEIGNREVEKKRENKEEEKTVGSFREHEENGLKMEIGELKKEDRKKRKNREVEEESRDEADEQRSNKKKKRRRGGEDDN